MSTGAKQALILAAGGFVLAGVIVWLVRHRLVTTRYALGWLVIALFVALAIDLPDLNETGLIGRTYDQAEARPRVGFFVETLGATLALLGSIGTLLFKPGTTDSPRESVVPG